MQEIIPEDRIYADKTPCIYEMLTELDVCYSFLSRPRRFGKTMLLILSCFKNFLNPFPVCQRSKSASIAFYFVQTNASLLCSLL
ncbi:MAG: AAA family ATPase [Deltaproteobacteria bacterium]|nr:AAA family ATPase [Deltaproteobacteria bacterium]